MGDFCTKRFDSSFGAWVIGHRWWVVLVSLLTVVVAGSGIQFLTFDRDLRIFFGEANPHLQSFEALEQSYTKGDNVLFVLAPENGNVFTRDTLAAVEELTEELWHMPYTTRVDSLTNYQHISVEGDDLLVRDLVKDAEHLTDADLLRIRRIALAEPSLVNYLTSPSGHVTGVIASLLLPEKASRAVEQVADSARELAEHLQRTHPQLRVYITGDVMFDDAYGRVSRDDMVTLVPVMFLMLALITALTLRSITGTAAVLLMIVMSVVTGTGIAGWIGMSLNPAAANAPTIILTVAVAGSIHILTTMVGHMRGGRSKFEAVAESLRQNLHPVFLTGITTAIGFLTLNFSESPPFRDLGNIATLGVLAALAYTLVFLPALMALLPEYPKPTATATRPQCDRLARFVITRRVPVFWGTAVGAILLSIGIVCVELGDDWIKYFDESYDFRIASDFTSRNLTGMQVIEYALDSRTSGGVNDPEYLAKVDAFVDWYRQQPHVVYVGAITDTIKRLNRIMHGGNDAYYQIPARRDLAAQYLLLYELSLPFGLDLNHRINIDKSGTRMTVLLKDGTTTELLSMDNKARQWLKANAPGIVTATGTGPSMIWAHLSARNIWSMVGGTIGALIAISGVLVFTLRSVKLGLVSLVPNVAPAFVAFGLWGLTVGRVGLGLSVVASLTLGIIVDDTIHFLSKYLRGRREQGMSAEEAVRYTFNTVGTALLTTSLVLAAGFLVLTSSGYQMNSDMGLMAAITISLALALDFLLLPTLLMTVDAKTEQTV